VKRGERDRRTCGATSRDQRADTARLKEWSVATGDKDFGGPFRECGESATNRVTGSTWLRLFCAKRPCWRKVVQRGGCWGEEEERWITQHAADRLNYPERHRAS
jgi:hypothetical protein